MALDALSSTNPCDLLNSDAYPDLWIKPSNTSPYANIAASGVTKTFLEVLAGKTLTAQTLTNLQPTNSSARLIQFMSGGGVTGATSFTQLENILLTKNSAKGSIVDTYFTSINTNYKTSYGNATLTDRNIWNPADVDSTGAVVSSPSSVLGKILADSFLLKLSDIYVPAQLTAQATPPAVASSSLIYLYKQQQGTTLTSAQQTRLATLEQRNLRFFGAFLAEYCFYRTRYTWLLQKYFQVYTASTFTAIPSGNPEMALFSGNGSGQNQYSGTTVSQSDFLKGIAYHLAILNTRMNDMRRLLSAINTFYTNIFRTIQTNINDASLVGSNSALTTTVNALNDSSIESKKYLSEAEFRKGVLEYNAEKNRYSNNLLGLYAFLNISALAIILHLYQS